MSIVDIGQCFLIASLSFYVCIIQYISINLLQPVHIYLIPFMSISVCLHLSKSIAQSTDCRICQLHLCKGVRPSQRVLDITLNHLMVVLQSWSFRECGVLCHYFQVHSLLKWQYVLGSPLLVKYNYLIIYYMWNCLPMQK